MGLSSQTWSYCIYITQLCEQKYKLAIPFAENNFGPFEHIVFFIYLFIVLRFQTSYNNCTKEAGTPQQLNTNYSGPFTKYKYKYRKQK
jgi:hypothetical protein